MIAEYARQTIPNLFVSQSPLPRGAWIEINWRNCTRCESRRRPSHEGRGSNPPKMLGLTDGGALLRIGQSMLLKMGWIKRNIFGNLATIRVQIAY